MKTTETIYEEMKAEYAALTGLAVTDGGDMAIRLYAAAVQLESLWQQAEWTQAQCFPQTAAGDALDQHAQLRGLTRLAATKAAGQITFSLSAAATAAYTLAAGVTCTNGAGTAFITTQAGSIPVGSQSCTVSAEAVDSGSGGNVPAGSVVNMTQAPTGIVSCTNAAAFTGGADAESDESLRSRVLSSYRSLPNGANRAYYESAAREIDGVKGVQVLSRNRGAGTVDVVITAPEGLPSAALVSRVQTTLAALREICVDVQAKAPTGVTVNVSCAVQAKSGYDGASVRSAVESALRAWFTGERLGETVLLAQLRDIIYRVEGVKNYTLTVPAADTAIDADELPVLGTLTVSEMGA